MDTLLERIRDLHDTIKEHPYWMSFEPSYKKEVVDLFRELMKECSKFYHTNNMDTPFVAIHRMLYHDFSHMLSVIRDTKGIENEDRFKFFFLVTLQNYLQVIHLMLEGFDNVETMVFFMCHDLHNPSQMVKHIAVYHDNCVTDEGYTFYSDGKHYHSVMEVKRKDVHKLLKELDSKKEKYKKFKSLHSFYDECIKDIEKETCFVYKIV